MTRQAMHRFAASTICALLVASCSGQSGAPLRFTISFDEEQGEEALEFFRKSWCTLDFPLAEAMVRGGRYERPRTLSEGDEVCDMRWIAEP